MTVGQNSAPLVNIHQMTKLVCWLVGKYWPIPIYFLRLDTTENDGWLLTRDLPRTVIALRFPWKVLFLTDPDLSCRFGWVVSNLSILLGFETGNLGRGKFLFSWDNQCSARFCVSSSANSSCHCANQPSNQIIHPPNPTIPPNNPPIHPTNQQWRCLKIAWFQFLGTPFLVHPIPVVHGGSRSNP